MNPYLRIFFLSLGLWFVIALLVQTVTGPTVSSQVGQLFGRLTAAAELGTRLGQR